MYLRVLGCIYKVCLNRDAYVFQCTVVSLSGLRARKGVCLGSEINRGNKVHVYKRNTLPLVALTAFMRIL